jgi:hypothetical protein
MHAFFCHLLQDQILEDEIRELDEEARIRNTEISRLQEQEAESAKLLKASEEEISWLSEEIQKQDRLFASLDEERELIIRQIVEAREKLNLCKREAETKLTQLKNENMLISTGLTEKESELRKAKRDRVDLQKTVERERLEIAKLESLRDGNAVQDDDILREKHILESEMTALVGKNEIFLGVIAELQQKLKVESQKRDESENEMRQVQMRLSEIAAQSLGLIQEKDKLRTEIDRMKDELCTVEKDRSDFMSQIASQELVLNNTLRLELKEKRRVLRLTQTKHEQQTKAHEAISAELHEAEKAYNAKNSRLHEIKTQNEFFQHEVASLNDTVSRAREELTNTTSQLQKVKSEDVSDKVLEARSTKDRLEQEIEQLKIELEFMSKHGMIGDDGLIKPLQIDSKDGDNSLIEKLSINEFLVRVQAQPDVSKVIQCLVEKMAEILQLIHDAEEMRERYQHDTQKASDICAHFKEKNRDLILAVEELRAFRRSALVQLGYNQTKIANFHKLFLQKLEFEDSDLEDLVCKLSLEERSKITHINLSDCKLVNFPLARLVDDFLNLRELDVSNNLELTSIDELERHLRTQGGITGVFRDARIIIANSGLQVRLTVHHGKA